ncbi:hypothetical protein ABK040_012623 [Willaertia magna]
MKAAGVFALFLLGCIAMMVAASPSLVINESTNKIINLMDTNNNQIELIPVKTEINRNIQLKTTIEPTEDLIYYQFSFNETVTLLLTLQTNNTIIYFKKDKIPTTTDYDLKLEEQFATTSVEVKSLNEENNNHKRNDPSTPTVVTHAYLAIASTNKKEQSFAQVTVMITVGWGAFSPGAIAFVIGIVITLVPIVLIVICLIYSKISGRTTKKSGETMRLSHGRYREEV